jgi:hypothetical protein
MPAAPVGPSVHALAARLRAHRLPALTDEVFAHIVEVMPDYLAVGSLTATELREACTIGLEQMLCELSSEDQQRVSLLQTGRRRAQQGLPLEWLLHSFRLCGRTIWQGLVAEATRAGGDDVRRLLGEAVGVWDALDRVSTIVAKAYRDEQSTMQRTTQRRREMVLSALMERRPPTPSVVAEASEVLGIPAHGPRFVVLSLAGSAHPEAMPTPEVVLRTAGFSSAWVNQGTRDSGLVALGDSGEADAVLQALAGCLPGAAAVSPLIDDFDEVAAAHRLTALALRTLPSTFHGIVRVTDRLPHALVAGAPEVSDVLVRHTLGGLLTLRPTERETYLTTLEALVDADGSFSAAARRLYCHRNTVLKRAHRIEALTGRRLTNMRSMVELYLAVLAVRMDAKPTS